jgi:pyruvate,water dikinase
VQVLTEEPLQETRVHGSFSERDVGGKATGLAFLHRLGLPVPAFSVLPAELFRAHLRRGGVPAALGEAMLELAEVEPGLPPAPAALRRASALLCGAVGAAEPDGVLREAATVAIDAIGDGPYAVRSSMVGEDSGRHSFAGQLESRLFVRDLEEILAAVCECWASAFAEPALAYAMRVGIIPTDVRMAVVIQRMVDAQVAGVTFTANPVSGDLGECLISAAFGLGEGVVAGVAQADEYTWAPGTGERSATVPLKDVQVVRSRSGAGTEEAPVPVDRRAQRVLSQEQVAEVAQLALRAATAAGRPMDIEWCYVDGAPYVLQARPITSLRTASNEPVRTFDNSNIQESYNGVTTPLTFSFASRAYATAFRSLVRTLGVSERSRAEFEPAARTLLALVGGRVYYNLESWQHMFSLFPGGARRTEEVATVMWHTEVDPASAAPQPLVRRLRRTLEAAGVGGRLIMHFVHMESEVERFLSDFEAVYRTVDRRRLADASLSELCATSRRLYSELLDDWDAPNINDLRVMMSCGRLRRLLERFYAGDEVDSRLGDLLGGIDGIESVAPTRRLVEIAHDARQHGEAAQALRTGTPETALDQLRERAPELAARLDDYVALYGDRSIGELKLETISLRDDPTFVVGVLRNYLDRPDIRPGDLVVAERERYRTALTELAAKLPAWRRPLLRREVAIARAAVKAREATRLCRTRAFGLARDIYSAMGNRLYEAGVLDDPRDVVYTTIDELEAFVDGRAVSTDLAPIVVARRAEYARYEVEDMPNRFSAAGSPYLTTRFDEAATSGGEHGDDQTTLRGLGCCAGVVQAPVRLMLDPREDLSVNGRVLCTERTDPGWAPLFPTASGLVVERGSALSHSAVVAREFGIPTVVGVPDVTRILTDGELVRVDGAAGEVQRINAPIREA